MMTLTGNDFRQVGLVVDPTTYGTSTVASASTSQDRHMLLRHHL